jgi:hypothetical protein
MRQPPTFPYQPDDRGFPASPSVKIPLPDSPDVALLILFCREKLKKKIDKSLRTNHNFSMCMHALTTFHYSFSPIELGNGQGYFYPFHGQHPENGKLWQASTECLTYCLKPRRTG